MECSSGRARRKEFWMFVLGEILLVYALAIIIGIMMGIAGAEEDRIEFVCEQLGNIWDLAFFLPLLAVGVRRLHDIGKRGGDLLWFVLVIGIIRLPAGWFPGSQLLMSVQIIGMIVMLVWLCRDSQPGANQDGPNPKGQ